MLFLVAAVCGMSLALELQSVEPVRKGVAREVAMKVGGTADMPDDTALLMNDGTQTTFGELKAQATVMIDTMVAGMVLIYSVAIVAFIVLGFVAFRHPFGACLAGLITYGLMVLVYFLINPLTLVSGIIFKVLVVSGLIGGMRAGLAEKEALARRQRRLEREQERAMEQPDAQYADEDDLAAAR
ncbi:MAG: hypothetical protein AB7K09_13675 [Planctomycetota bacterium]